MKTHFLRLFVLLCAIVTLLCSCSTHDSKDATVTTGMNSGTSPTIPAIDTFSGIEWEAYADEATYLFAYEELPPVKSASIRIGGREETHDPADPRLIRLLNAIVYGYCSGDSIFTQGMITDQEILPCLNADVPVLDVFFASSEKGGLLGKTERVLICANSCLFFVDGNDYDYLEPSERYAWQHWPYLGIKRDLGAYSENDMTWGNNCWINLLEYAGF